MKRLIISTGCIAALLVSASVAVAQGRGGGPKVKPAAGAAAKAGGGAGHGGPKAGGPRAGQAAGKTHGPAMKSNPGATHAKAPKTTGPKTPGPKPKSNTTPAGTTTTAANTSKKGQTTTATTDTLSPVQLKLQRNTNLASKLETRLAGKLPAGMTLLDAAENFSNLGRFVSAVNASYNHDLDFVKLKTAIVDEGMSLGQAMKEQRSSLALTDATKAEIEADALIKSAETAATQPATSKTKTRSSRN